MENFLSLLESVETSWLTPSSTTWAMDMILAFVCGLGLFCLILPLLPPDLPSPTPAENTTPQKVVRKEHRKVRKKIRTVKVYRGSRKKPEEDKELGSLLHSMQERLVNSISICRHLGQNASGEAFKPDAAKAHLSPREPTGKSVATKSSLETSSVPSKEHLLLKDSKPLSPVLPNSSPIESQSSVSASSPPETLTTGRHHSPPQQRAPSYPSHPWDPVACPPSMPDPSMATPHIERKILATSRSHILPGLPSPVPTTPETNLSRRPTLTTPGLNYSSRSTSTRPDLDHLSRPTSNTPGLNDLSRPTSTNSDLDPFSRPTSIIPGLEHSSRPIPDHFMYKITSRTLCHSTSSPDESLQEDLSLTIHKTSYWTGSTDRQREAGDPSFISPVIQEMPEVQIRQGVQLNVSKGKIKGRSDLSSSCTGSMLHSCSSKETTISAHSIWSKEFKLEQFLGHQRVLTHELKEEYWGLPWLHSESLGAHVSMAGSPLDSPSILFNGLSTYSPLLPNLVKSQPLSPKFSWSLTPSETRIHAKAHDPYSLSKLPCDSAPIRDNGASRLIPSRAKIIVSPKVQQLEHHLLKYRESRCDLQVMVKRSLEEFSQQTFKSWGSQGQGPVVHLQGDYISPELREQTEEPGGVCYHVSVDPQQAPETEMKTKVSSVESQTTQNSPVLQPALLREVQPNNNSVPSEAPTTAQAFNVTSMSTPKCLVGRAWHRDTVVRSSAEYPEPNPCRVQGVWEAPESEAVNLRQNHHGVSVREISGASQSTYSRDTRELEDTEDEESCNWTRPTEAGKMGDVPVHQLLEISRNLASPSNTYSEDIDDSSLSSAAGLALRDCAPGKVCQDWAPEVLLAADILASRTSRSTFKMEPTTTKAPFLDRSSLSSRGRSVHKNCRLQHNHSFATSMGKERCSSLPRQDTQLKRPVQAHTLNNENLWDRIKKFILSILIPKFKLQENPKQKCKALPSITQSQVPLIGPYVPRSPLNRPVYHQEQKKNQKSISTVYHANLKSQPSLYTGMPYGNKQAWATRVPVFQASPYYKRAHMHRAPGIPVCCPRHGDSA